MLKFKKLQLMGKLKMIHAGVTQDETITTNESSIWS